MNRNRFRFPRNRGGSANNRTDKKLETVHNEDESTVVKYFQGYGEELSSKHDRYERIIKQSRDITIESKRLIFLMHSIDLRKSNAEKTLCEVFNRLMALCNLNFSNIAKEMAGLDHYQYARAYSAGIQEFIEAFTYYDYLKNNRLVSWDDLQAKLTYTMDESLNELVENEENNTTVVLSDKTSHQFICLVQPTEFMLGLADLSGEIMRKCINSLGSGDVDACQQARHFVQNLYSGYLLSGSFRNKEMTRKISAMHQSVLKIEKVCYNVKVRGKEAARWMTNDQVEKHDDEDAGFVSC